MVKNIESKAEFDAIINSGKVVFIDYYADWCGPCKQISPKFEQHEKDHEEKEGVEFYKVNVDDVPDVAEANEITAMPTFHGYHKGQRFDKMVGANPTKLTALVQSGVQKLV